MDRTVPSPIDRRLLILAAVVNRRGETSERFVDAEFFELWRIAMRDRHSIDVTGQTTLLWLPEHEYRRHARLFEQQGAGRDVTRLSLTHFDPRSHRTHHVTRFVAAEQVDAVAQRLQAHLWGPHVEHTNLVCTPGKAVGAETVASSLHAA